MTQTKVVKMQRTYRAQVNDRFCAVCGARWLGYTKCVRCGSTCTINGVEPSYVGFETEEADCA